MKPIKFKGQNVVFAENQEGVLPLPAFRDEDGVVVTCWELTNEDFERLVETKLHDAKYDIYLTYEIFKIVTNQ